MKTKPTPAPAVKRPMKPQVMWADKIGHVWAYKGTADMPGSPGRPVLVIDASPEGLAELKERMARAIDRPCDIGIKRGETWWATYWSWYPHRRTQVMRQVEAALSVLTPTQPRVGRAGKKGKK